MEPVSQPSPRGVHHPVFARVYERFSEKAESRGVGEHRDRLLAGLRGRVVEVGAGNGLNFAHYPSTVSEVVAVEPEPFLRARSTHAAERAGISIRVVDGVADRLPLEDASCDAGVTSLVLCSVPDQEAALVELFRVIRPGGELRFYEHVRSRNSGVGRVQGLADATFWPRVAGGCHMARETGAAIERAGFRTESRERFGFPPGRLEPSVPYVLGVARRP